MRRLPLIFQSEAAECGLACLAMVASYYGHILDLATLRRRYSVSLRGATLANLMEVAVQLGLKTRALRLEPSDLGSLRLPCIIHWKMSHFVVLAETTPKGVVLHDPALGRRRVGEDEFGTGFTGVALELSPNDGFTRTREDSRFKVRNLVGTAPDMRSGLFRIAALAVLLEVSAILGPLLLQWTIDRAIASAQIRTLAVIGLALGLLAALEAALSMARAWETVALSSRLNVGWLSTLCGHMLELPVPYFERRNVGDILSRFSSADAIQRTITTSFVEVVLDGAVAVVMLAVMFCYSTTLSLLVICGACAYLAVRTLSFSRLRASTEQEIICAAEQQTYMLETLRGIHAVKLFCREAQRRAGWHNQLVGTTNARAESEKWAATFRAASLLIFGLEMAAVLWLAARLVIEGQFTVGMLFAFVAYKDQFNVRVNAMLDRTFDFRMLGLQAERLGDILLEAPELPGASGPSPPIVTSAAVEVRAVWFRYSGSDPWVVRNFSLRAEPGECVAIVGPSGSGKSTVFKLVAGLLVPERGEILVFGEPIASNRRGVAGQMGVVLQDDSLFAGSIAQNIHFFDGHPDRNRVEECARLAAVDTDIETMPMKYDTLIGHAGAGISGGQKQRILIARALYGAPSILLLDEAASHLDLASERVLACNLAALHVTRIVAAHRPETIAIADRVVEVGTAHSTGLEGLGGPPPKAPAARPEFEKENSYG